MPEFEDSDDPANKRRGHGTAQDGGQDRAARLGVIEVPPQASHFLIRVSFANVQLVDRDDQLPIDLVRFTQTVGDVFL